MPKGAQARDRAPTSIGRNGAAWRESPRNQRVNRSGWRSLLVPGATTPVALNRQAEVILGRVRVIALASALITLGWGLADILVFPQALALELILARVATCLMLLVVGLMAAHATTINGARTVMGLLVLVPTVFFYYAQFRLDLMVHDGSAQLLVTVYRLFPFVIVSGISLFPMTALAGVLLVSPVIGFEIVYALGALMTHGRVELMSETWLLIVLAAVAIVASVFQLQLLQSLVHGTAHDGLTGAFNRLVGEELLQLQFTQARRGDSALTVAVIDLDDFKRVNDTAGHEAGDKVLRDYGAWLRGGLRSGDVITRWGGDEFLLALPDTDCNSARQAFVRLWRQRPGGEESGLQTASIGLAERQADRTESWQDLVRVADARAYAAKHGGKDRLVDGQGELLPWPVRA